MRDVVDRYERLERETEWERVKDRERGKCPFGLISKRTEEEKTVRVTVVRRRGTHITLEKMHCTFFPKS